MELAGSQGRLVGKWIWLEVKSGRLENSDLTPGRKCGVVARSMSWSGSQAWFAGKWNWSEVKGGVLENGCRFPLTSEKWCYIMVLEVKGG